MPEPKTIRTWTERGYSFARQGECPACHMPVEIWNAACGGKDVPLNPQTLETHFSSCRSAKSFRTVQQMKEGRL